MSKVFFTADYHYSHANIIKYCNRPFLNAADQEVYERNGKSWHDGDWKGERASNHRISPESVQMMNDAIVANTNKIVGKDDTLYFLGDWAFGGKHNYYRNAKELRDRLKCERIIMIWGNHDDEFVINNLFNTDANLMEIDVQGQRITLCHYAMAVWNKSHRGAWQLYGHSHTNLENWIDKAMPGHLSMDVGIDNAYRLLGEFRPFSFEEIKRIMNDRGGFFPDHHGNRRKLVSGPTEEEIIEKS